METEAEYSWDDRLVGMTIPRPSRRAGKAKSSRSVSVGGALPVQAGISLVLWCLQRVVTGGLYSTCR